MPTTTSSPQPTGRVEVWLKGTERPSAVVVRDYVPPFVVYRTSKGWEVGLTTCGLCAARLPSREQALALATILADQPFWWGVTDSDFEWNGKRGKDSHRDWSDPSKCKEASELFREAWAQFRRRYPK